MRYSSQFYINMTDKPTWAKGKDFEEQKRDVQQFYIEEARKLKTGVTIGGVKIHPWLYWHLNYWTFLKDLPPDKEGNIESVHSYPDLRDTEWMLQEALFRANKENKGIIGFGSRRIAKSVFISSWLGYNATTKFGGELRVNSVIGGTQKDLDNIADYVDYGLDNIHPFFKMDKVGKDWDTGVTLGTRNTDNSKEIFSKMTITNVNMGTKKSTQKAAGATPNTLVMDEIGKFSFLKTFNTAKYSIATEHGWRTIPILFGCVCKGTKVYDKYGKLKDIESITKESGILGYNGDNTSIEDIPYIQSPKQKKCVYIKTKGGREIKCSWDHPLLVTGENLYKNKGKVFFKRASEITTQDRVMSYIGEIPFGDINLRHSELIGLLIGDGYYGSSVELSCSDKSLQTHIESNLKELQIGTVKKELNNPYYINYTIKGLIPYLREIGIYGDTKLNKKLPVNIYEFSKYSISGLLRGYFEADGFISKSLIRPRITLTSISNSLLQEVKDQLIKFGIRSNIYLRNNSSTNLISKVNKKSYIIPATISYSLEINDSISIINFNKSIGFISEYKKNILYILTNKLESSISKKITNGYQFQNRLEGKGRFFIDKVCNNIILDKVVSVEDIGEQDVYNLTAGQTHTYITNGFISHNTGGETSESADAQKVINNPGAYNLLEMDWGWLERRGNKPTWQKKVWGIFFPGQMSLDSGVPKKPVALSEYLGVENKELRDINILETQWEETAKHMSDRRKKLQIVDKKTYDDELMFMPMDLDDCFLDGGSNPFPMAEATRHKNKIVQIGDTGRIVDVFKKHSQQDAQIEFDFSKKPIAEFPFEGGILDCGIQVFQDPPEENDFDYTYVAGLDHYKHIESTGDSIGALYIFKRYVNLKDEFANRIVCSYVSRPASMTTFNRTCEMLLEGYGAECLQENADISFQQYLEAKGKDIKLLANGEEVAQRMISGTARQVNKFGLSPTTKNKEYLLKVIIQYCWEVLESYIDKDGNEVSILGVERINDVQLLDEIIGYKPGKNVDRIIAFAHALVWARYLDDIRVLPRVKPKKGTQKEQERREDKMLKIKEVVRSNPYSKVRKPIPRR